jgi:hypothetical protein
MHASFFSVLFGTGRNTQPELFPNKTHSSSLTLPTTHNHSVFSSIHHGQTNQPPVHPCDGPIINHAITTILPSTPSFARQSAQHRHIFLVFVAAVEAEESSFSRLTAVG